MPVMTPEFQNFPKVAIDCNSLRSRLSPLAQLLVATDQHTMPPHVRPSDEQVQCFYTEIYIQQQARSES